jgi:undecaprenyl diphosphate synthase
MTTPKELPRHMAIIMDGNGRWARARGLPRVAGHRQGAKAVQRITRACRRIGVPALTLYAFSQQNWRRPAAEVRALMELLRDYIQKERAEILENGIRLTAIGHTPQLPGWVREPLERLIAESAHNDDMELCLALSYGGREEIIRAAKELVAMATRHEIGPSDVNEALVEKHLWTAHLPPLDFVVRTSGERRFSNFLLWQGAYAELYFTDVLWPDFEEKDLIDALEAFASRERRFGRIPAQTLDTKEGTGQ